MLPIEHRGSIVPSRFGLVKRMAGASTLRRISAGCIDVRRDDELVALEALNE
jgi:hypothetical protein